MPGTLTSLHYHVVFSTRERRPLILPTWQGRLHAYVGGIIRELQATPLAIGGTANHVHILLGLKPTHCLSRVMQDVKGTSSKWVHNTLRDFDFAWQEGFGAFTVGHSELDTVRNYVDSQELHHSQLSYEDEFLHFLQTNKVKYNPKYLWEPALAAPAGRREGGS